MKKNLFTIAFLMCLHLCYSTTEFNTPPGKGGLKIGDHVPAITVTHLHNYTSAAASLTAFYKNKPLILVFWNTHCNTCLRSLPKLNALVQQQGGAFNVLSVTEENDAAVQKLFSSLDTLKNICLPYITDDKLFAQYFPHRYIPHVIWINTKGIVAAVTSEDEVTAANIKAFIENHTVTLFEKNDDFTFDMYKPYSPPDSLLQYRSALSKYNPSVAAAFLQVADRDSMGKIISMDRVLMINTTITNLFYAAFANITGSGNYISPVYARIIFDVSDQSKYNFSVDTADETSMNWKMNNLYSYELITGPQSRTDFYKTLFDELNRCFAVRASIEKREMPCYILTIKDSTKLVFAKPGEAPLIAGTTDNATGVTKYSIRNMSFSETLISDLNQFRLNEPVYDETGIDKPVDLELNFRVKNKQWNSKYDVELLRSELAKYGLDLQPTWRLMDVLVIKDK